MRKNGITEVELRAVPIEWTIFSVHIPDNDLLEDDVAWLADDEDEDN
jgi:hypothetical protein